MPRLARHELTLIHVEGTLDIDVRIPREECTKIERLLLCLARLSTHGIQCSRLEQTVVDPNLDDEYDSDYERSAGSKESADLRAWLDARRAQLE